MKEWLEWITTTKAECPTCHTGTVRKVCKVRLAATSHQRPGVERIDSDEVWLCCDCGEHFIKEPADRPD